MFKWITLENESNSSGARKAEAVRDVAEVQALDVEYVLHRGRVGRVCAREPAYAERLLAM